MNAQNTKALVESFPALYCGADRRMADERTPRFFFECRDSWFNLIFRLSQRLETAARRAGASSDSEECPRALQVKGKLRNAALLLDAGDGRIFKAHRRGRKGERKDL